MLGLHRRHRRCGLTRSGASREDRFGARGRRAFTARRIGGGNHADSRRRRSSGCARADLIPRRSLRMILTRASAIVVASLVAFGGAPVATLAADDAAAKKDGTVVWYGTMNTKDMALTAEAFMKAPPGIKVETLRLGSSQLPARIA